MEKKVLVFIYDGKEFLALRNNPKDPKHGGDYWYTVTGHLDTGEGFEQAAIRETKEETNLKVTELLSLNCGALYHWHGKDHEQHNYLAFVHRSPITLNNEKVEYAWLPLGKFLTKITWWGDKEQLKTVLKLALQKKLVYATLHLEDQRNLSWKGISGA